MQTEYYILSLNNNDSKCPYMLDNIIYKGEGYDIPSVFEEAKKIEIYESVEILAVKSLFCLRDVISGEVISESPNNICGLSFYASRKTTPSELIDITRKYESMSNEDIMRYKNKIRNIKEKSIKKFESDKLNKINLRNEELKAREFLVNFNPWNN